MGPHPWMTKSSMSPTLPKRSYPPMTERKAQPDAHGFFFGEFVGHPDHVGSGGDVLVLGEAAPERDWAEPSRSPDRFAHSTGSRAIWHQ